MSIDESQTKQKVKIALNCSPEFKGVLYVHYVVEIKLKSVHLYKAK